LNELKSILKKIRSPQKDRIEELTTQIENMMNRLRSEINYPDPASPAPAPKRIDISALNTEIIHADRDILSQANERIEEYNNIFDEYYNKRQELRVKGNELQQKVNSVIAEQQQIMQNLSDGRTIIFEECFIDAVQRVKEQIYKEVKRARGKKFKSTRKQNNYAGKLSETIQGIYTQAHYRITNQFNKYFEEVMGTHFRVHRNDMIKRVKAELEKQSGTPSIQEIFGLVDNLAEKWARMQKIIELIKPAYQLRDKLIQARNDKEQNEKKSKIEKIRAIIQATFGLDLYIDDDDDLSGILEHDEEDNYSNDDQEDVSLGESKHDDENDQFQHFALRPNWNKIHKEKYLCLPPKYIFYDCNGEYLLDMVYSTKLYPSKKYKRRNKWVIQCFFNDILNHVRVRKESYQRFIQHYVEQKTRDFKIPSRCLHVSRHNLHELKKDKEKEEIQEKITQLEAKLKQKEDQLQQHQEEIEKLEEECVDADSDDELRIRGDICMIDKRKQYTDEREALLLQIEENKRKIDPNMLEPAQTPDMKNKEHVLRILGNIINGEFNETFIQNNLDQLVEELVKYPTVNMMYFFLTAIWDRNSEKIMKPNLYECLMNFFNYDTTTLLFFCCRFIKFDWAYKQLADIGDNMSWKSKMDYVVSHVVVRDSVNKHRNSELPSYIRQPFNNYFPGNSGKMNLSFKAKCWILKKMLSEKNSTYPIVKDLYMNYTDMLYYETLKEEIQKKDPPKISIQIGSGKKTFNKNNVHNKTLNEVFTVEGQCNLDADYVYVIGNEAEVVKTQLMELKKYFEHGLEFSGFNIFYGGLKDGKIQDRCYMQHFNALLTRDLRMGFLPYSKYDENIDMYLWVYEWSEILSFVKECFIDSVPYLNDFAWYFKGRKGGTNATARYVGTPLSINTSHIMKSLIWLPLKEDDKRTREKSKGIAEERKGLNELLKDFDKEYGIQWKTEKNTKKKLEPMEPKDLKNIVGILQKKYANKDSLMKGRLIDIVFDKANIVMTDSIETYFSARMGIVAGWESFDNDTRLKELDGHTLDDFKRSYKTLYFYKWLREQVIDDQIVNPDTKEPFIPEITKKTKNIANKNMRIIRYTYEGNLKQPLLAEVSRSTQNLDIVEDTNGQYIVDVDQMENGKLVTKKKGIQCKNINAQTKSLVDGNIPLVVDLNFPMPATVDIYKSRLKQMIQNTKKLLNDTSDTPNIHEQLEEQIRRAEELLENIDGTVNMEPEATVNMELGGGESKNNSPSAPASASTSLPAPAPSTSTSPSSFLWNIRLRF